MPLGVEHPEEMRGLPRIFDVILALMPLGVEHAVPAELERVAQRDPRIDAVRR